MKIIEKRIPTILNSQLVTHLIPLVHATFDMFIFRDGKAVLKLTGSVYTLMKIFGIIGITFEIYLETLCYFNGGFYPYPVLYKLNTLQKKIIFVIVVWLFTSFLAISLRFLLGLLIKFYPWAYTYIYLYIYNVYTLYMHMYAYIFIDIFLQR